MDTRPAGSMTWTVRSGADLGRAIADIRDLRRLTQEELAREMVIGRSYLSKIEAGRSVSLLEHMLRAFRRLGAQVTVTYDHLPDGATESA